MSITYKSPGVYREDVVVKIKKQLSTGIPCFIGFADEKVVVSSQTQQILGAELVPASFPRIPDNRLWYDIVTGSLICSGPLASASLEHALTLLADVAGRSAVRELYRKSQKKLNFPVMLAKKEEFSSNFSSLPDRQSYLSHTVNGFFENGGVYCYVIHADASLDKKDALYAAITKGLALLNDIDLVAIPDCMVLDNQDDVLAVQRKLLAHCAGHAGRFALLDSMGSKYFSAKSDIIEVVKNQRCEVINMNKLDPDPSDISTDQGTITPSANGAIYFPWIRIVNGPENDPVPPCGHIAGIYARSDKTVGVFKAPANEELIGVYDLQCEVTNGQQEELNPEGINCLRAFPGRGIRVWGSRTLCQEETWRYINVRRLVLTVSRWIEAHLAWASFEPNTPLLWVRISRELTVFLSKLWQAGALAGERADQAFFVKCDTETNPVESREMGGVVTQIGLAPTVPAEFIIVKIIHRAGTTEIT